MEKIHVLDEPHSCMNFSAIVEEFNASELTIYVH